MSAVAVGKGKKGNRRASDQLRCRLFTSAAGGKNRRGDRFQCKERGKKGGKGVKKKIEECKRSTFPWCG